MFAGTCRDDKHNPGPEPKADVLIISEGVLQPESI